VLTGRAVPVDVTLMSRWLFVLVAGVGAVVTAATPESAFGHGVYLITFGCLELWGWVAVLRSERRDRLPFALLVLAQTGWLLGDMADTWIDWPGASYTVGIPDVMWLGGYPLFGSGLVLMVRRRGSHQGRAATLDGLTLATAFALVMWQIVVIPAIDQARVGADTVVAVLYPLGDVVLIASVLYLVLSPGLRGWPIRLLSAGMGLTLAGDLGFSVLPRLTTELNVDRVNGLLLLANALIVAAVRDPARHELLTGLRPTAETVHPARSVFLALALLTAPLMAISHTELEFRQQLVLLAGTVVTVALSVARFTGAVREQVRVQRLLAHQAAHDALTGLANRRTLIDHLETRPNAGTVLLYVDLDRFKEVNDRYGHAAGDAVLVEVAARLQREVRTGDLVARLGGDEFAVLCRRLEPDMAAQLADRLALAVERPTEWAGELLSVSASIGMATGEQCDSGDDLINTADNAMFVAKRRGRPAMPALEPGPV
jgi:diguanylate cyclase (GGDEF)-like protein